MLVDGPLFGDKEISLGKVIDCGEKFEISIKFIAPQQPGKYVAFYKLVHGVSRKFGPKVWCDILVKG